MGDESLSLKVSLESARTQNELEQLRRKTTEFRKSQLLGSQEFVAAAKLEVDIKNKLHTINQQAYSDNAKLKESYFETGQKLRSLKLAGVEAAQALGYQAGGLGAVFASMIGPAGALGAVAGGVGLLISHFNDLATAARNAANAGLSAFMAGGRFAPGTLEAQRANVQAQQNALSLKYGLIGRGGVYGNAGAQIQMSSADFQKRTINQEVLKMLDDEIAKESALNQIRQMGLQIVQNRVATESGGAGGVGGPSGRGQAPGHYFDQYGPGIQDFRISGNMPVEGLSPQGLRGSRIGGKQGGPADQSARFNSELARSISLSAAVGNSITSHIGGALQGIIGQAQGFEGVLLGILGDIFGSVVSFAVGSAFAGPAGGIAALGGTFGGGFGQRGGTGGRTVGGTSRGGGGGGIAEQIAQALSSGSFRVRGTDLVWVQEKGRNILQAARI